MDKKKLFLAVNNLSYAASKFKGNLEEHEQLLRDKALLLSFLNSLVAEQAKEQKEQVIDKDKTQ